LLDRMEVIELNSYTLFEKKDIAKKYLLPRIYEEHVIGENNLKFTDELIYFIINSYTAEAGVRDLERVLTSLIRKLVINNIKTINKDKVIRLLGTPKYNEKDYEFGCIPGVANTLAITNAGGIVTKLEVAKFRGDGKVLITGSVGKVMEESVNVAMTYLKSEYNHTFNNCDVHLHFLDASTKKDGPSAGMSIAAALLSILEKQAIPNDIAFTGELSLNGTILKIGGLKEKLIGAYNRGIKKVFIPIGNEEDLKEVPSVIIEEIEITPVVNFKEIYTTLFK
ncbi:MAG: endopeptidase La, partial [Bacilli bacterium]|nr:endopeptidase La [Bacilli bacterium]